MAGNALAEANALHLPSRSGALPPSWSWSRLDDACEGVFDCPHSTPQLVSSGPLVVRSQDIITGVLRTEQSACVSEETYRERTSRVVPVHGDLLFSREGTYFGIAAEVPEHTRLCLGQRMVLMRPKASMIDFRFLRHWLNSPIMASHIHGYRDGSVAERLNLPTIRALPVLIPPVPEQRAIAHILGTLEVKIEVNRRMNETLEAMARALFKSWFVDFDPVRAKAEGRDSVLPKFVADLFPDSFEVSEQGEIPNGWSMRSIYDIADVVYGAPFASAQFNTERRGEPLVRIRDLIDESPGVWTPEVHPKGNKIRPGDIVVGMDGEFRAYLWGGEEAWFNQRICVFVPKNGHSAAFVRNSIIEPLANIEATETATTVIHLGKSDIDKFLAVVPSQSVLMTFNRACQPWYDRIVAAKRECRSLAALRDTLLPMLVSGRLRVNSGQQTSGVIA
jgi:type I restriction enzyme, S subunit